MRDGRRRSHILDPRTGRPVRHRLASVSVLAATTMRADAWATALLVLGPDAGLDLARREGLAVLMLAWDGEELMERSTPEFRRHLVEGEPARPSETGGFLRGWIGVLAGFVLMSLTALALAVRRPGRRCPPVCAAACPGLPVRRETHPGDHAHEAHHDRS